MRQPLVLKDFLDAVDAQIHRLGTRDHVRIERLVQSRGGVLGWEPAALRDAVAATLARDRDELKRIAELFEIYAVSDLSPDGSPPEALETRSFRPVEDTDLKAIEEAETKAIAQREAVERVWSLPHWRWGVQLALAAVALSAAAGGLVWWLGRPDAAAIPDDTEILGTSDDEGEGSVAEPEGRWVRYQIAPAREIAADSVAPEDSAPPERSLLPPRLALGFLFAGALLAVFGIRARRLAASAEETRKDYVAGRAASRREKLEALVAEATKRGEPVRVRYHVATWPGISPRALEDSATSLGRLTREVAGRELDTEATLAATVDGGGRWAPRLAPQLLRRRLVVLIDVERGDPPWVGGFQHTLDAWIRQGVDLQRYTYRGDPGSLTRSTTRDKVSLAALSRTMEGAPLIVFARTLQTRNKQGALRDWIAGVRRFGRRAWLDPDAGRGDSEIAAAKARDAGLTRFPWSDRGAIAMARWMRDDGSHVRPPAPRRLPALPPADAGDALAEALRCWAVLGALVPDANWDQLEAFRRDEGFPELAPLRGEPRALHLLLDWFRRESGAAVEGLGVIDLPTDLRRRLVADQRRWERRVGGVSLLARGRETLNRQLGDRPPEGRLERQWWEFKRRLHCAFLEPERAAELLLPMMDAAIGHEVAAELRGELDAQEHDADAAVFSAVARAQIRDAFDESEGIPLGEVLWAHRRIWGQSLVAGALVGLVGAAVWMARAASAPREAPIGGATVVAPADYAVARCREARLAETAQRPGMVGICAGGFEMGSEEGDEDERPRHDVKLTVDSPIKPPALPVRLEEV